jgi:hypothetical protein
MRTWGRINGGVNGIGGTWIEVSTDSAGFNCSVQLTTLCQTLLLASGEDPLNANLGIPGIQAITQQLFPDAAAAAVQAQYAPSFASLTVARVPGSFPPTYNVNCKFPPGAVLPAVVAT